MIQALLQRGQALNRPRIQGGGKVFRYFRYCSAYRMLYSFTWIDPLIFGNLNMMEKRLIERYDLHQAICAITIVLRGRDAPVTVSGIWLEYSPDLTGRDPI